MLVLFCSNNTSDLNCVILILNVPRSRGNILGRMNDHRLPVSLCLSLLSVSRNFCSTFVSLSESQSFIKRKKKKTSRFKESSKKSASVVIKGGALLFGLLASVFSGEMN